MTNEDVRFLDAFAAYWRSMGYSPETCHNYSRDLRLLAEQLPLGECTALDLHGFVSQRSTEVGPSTLSVTVRGLRAFYRWRASVLECDDPSKSLRSPRVPETPVRSVSELEYRRLLGSLVGNDGLVVRDRALFSLLWATGMRRSEVARIERDHVDLAEGVVTIPRTKNGKPRTVGLTPEAVRHVRAYLKRRWGKDSSMLWIGRAGRPLTGDGIRQALATRCTDAGMRVIGAHEFRRSLAERWLEAGGSESLLRFHAGWSSPVMTARYVRNRGQALAVAEHRRLLA